MKFLIYLQNAIAIEPFMDAIHLLNIDMLTFLHILSSEHHSDNKDLSVSMAPNIKSILLDKLIKIDAERSQLDNKAGRLLLQHACDYMKDHHGITSESILKRGKVFEIITDLFNQNDCLILNHFDYQTMVSLIEPLIKTHQKPILNLKINDHKKINKAVIAYDGSKNIEQSLQFFLKKPIHSLSEIHILLINDMQKNYMNDAQNMASELQKVGYKTDLATQEGHVAKKIIEFSDHIDTDLLVAGAYGHSPLRHFLFGSTTNYLLKHSEHSMLIF